MPLDSTWSTSAPPARPSTRAAPSAAGRRASSGERGRCQASRPPDATRALKWQLLGREARGRRTWAWGWPCGRRSTGRVRHLRPWRPTRRRRVGRGWPRSGAARRAACGAAGRRDATGCEVHAPRRQRDRARGTGSSGGGLVTAWAPAGSTVTIIGTAKAVVPATAALRKSLRPCAGPAPTVPGPPCLSPLPRQCI